MLPILRKSVEPLAAYLEPEHVSARHQSLHHFVAKSEWSDTALLEQVRRWVLPHMDPAGSLHWIIDDTGFPKKGKHSVGGAILRPVGQARQLPSYGESVGGDARREPTGVVSTVSAA